MQKPALFLEINPAKKVSRFACLTMERILETANDHKEFEMALLFYEPSSIHTFLVGT